MLNSGSCWLQAKLKVMQTYMYNIFFPDHDSFGQGDGAILLDNVNCYYTSYLHLLSCRYSTAISRSCSHADDVAVTCCK